jgi:peptidoglycan hydrolase-like protein with peptidoglycan-binding domain
MIMPVKILAVIILTLFLSGCATTKKGNNIETQQLKSRVASLETDLQTREQEITRLGDELEKAREKRPVLKEEKTKEVKQVESKKLSTTQIQRALKNAGFYRGAVDGKMGQTTIEAIKAFQRANGLKADGVVGRKTRAILTRYSTGSNENRVK